MRSKAVYQENPVANSVICPSEFDEVGIKNGTHESRKTRGEKKRNLSVFISSTLVREAYSHPS
jgi:hypothetical protein